MARRIAVLAALFLAAPAPAHAHILMSSPAPRYEELKYGPCGNGATDARTRRVTSYKPGARITVRWRETIGHPGHYRIAFDPDGQRFTDPTSFTDTAPRQYVLVDDIADKTGQQEYAQEITLPNMTTMNGTLQLIQVMTDKAPYGDGNDLYYQCADIVLDPSAPEGGSFVDGTMSSTSSSTSSSGSSTSSGATSKPSTPTTTPTTEDGGCSVSDRTTTGLATLAAAAFALTSQRRRRR